MYERFTDRARKVMQLANQEAQRFNHEYIGTEHILLGLVKEGSGVAANVLKNLDIDLRKVRSEVEKLVQPSLEVGTPGKLPQTPRAKKVIEYSIVEARNLNHNYVGTEHLLLGLLREQEGVAAQVLMNLNLRLEDVREEVLNLLGHNMVTDEGRVSSIPLSSEPQPATGKSKTPALDSFGRDLTELARQSKSGLLVGRTAEIEKILVVLSGRVQPCLLLVGEVGSGKRAIVQGVAERIASGAVPDGLPLQRVVTLDLGSLLLGSADWYRQAGERFRASLNEAQRSQTVLCLEGLSLLFADWATGSAGLFQAILRQTPPPLIAPITPAEYREYVAPKEDLAALFQPIFVEPLTREETVEVLRRQNEQFEAHHGVLIPELVLPLVTERAERALSGCLPGKALRLLDRAAALVRIRMSECPLDLGSLNQQIELLNQEKEAAIVAQDFEKAACFRDQADQIKRCRDQALRAWEERSRRSIPAVDEQAVAEALVTLGGAGDPARPNVIA